MAIFTLRNLALSSMIISGGFLLSSFDLSASAASFRLDTNDASWGDDIAVDFNLTQVDANTVKFDVNVDETTGITGDLRGVFFNFDDANLSGLGFGSSLSSNVSLTKIDADNPFSELNAGQGNKININGGGGHAFMGGLIVGTSGGLKGGSDDFQDTFFTLTRADGLSIDDFQGENFGVRLQSVGANGSRGGSSKVAGTADWSPEVLFTQDVDVDPPMDIPEPTALAALGLMGFGLLKTKRRSAA